jgi:hypothetical protein
VRCRPSSSRLAKPKLFSASTGRGPGWGGRINDLFEAGNGTSTLTIAPPATPFPVSRTAASTRHRQRASALLNNAAGLRLVDRTQHLRADDRAWSNLFEDERAGDRGLSTCGAVGGALAAAPLWRRPSPPATARRPAGIIARLISVSQQLGAKPVFASLGGFDTHDDAGTPRPDDPAGRRYAQRRDRRLGVADKVTAFTRIGLRPH